MKHSSITALVALVTCAFANPLPGNEAVSPSLPDGHALDPSATALSNLPYLAAWEHATGVKPVNSPEFQQGSPGLQERAVGPINGHNQYVAIYFRDGRFVITLVAVMNLRGGFRDGLSSTPDVANAVAGNARRILGAAGAWSAASWAFYSMPAYNIGFTVVARNLLPKKFQDYAAVLALAGVLAHAYGLPSDAVFWAYPQNNKRNNVAIQAGLEHFSILSDFTPTVELADMLIEMFHGPNGTATSMTPEEQSSLSSRQTCLTSLDTGRIIRDWVPWNTAADIGCHGSKSDF